MTCRLALLLCLLWPVAGWAAELNPAQAVQATQVTDETRLWQRVETAPDTPGAWLDLAVHYCETGQATAAGRIFRLLEDRYAPPPGIRELIVYLRNTGCRSPEPATAPGNIVHLRWLAGRDSNPNQGMLTNNLTLTLDGQPVRLEIAPASRPQPDQWQGAEWAWLGHGAGWQPFVLGAIRHYQRQDSLNTEQLVFGLQEVDNAGNEKRLGASLLTLGGNYSHAQLSGYLQRPFHAPAGLAWGVGAAVQHFPDHTEQDSIQIEPRLVFGARATVHHDARLQLGAVLDQPLQDRPGGLRQSLVLRADARFALSARWYLDGQLRLQQLRETSAYSPLFGNRVRRGSEATASLSLGYALTRDDSLSLSLQQQRAHDNIPLFAFTRQQMVLSYAHLFR